MRSQESKGWEDGKYLYKRSQQEIKWNAQEEEKEIQKQQPNDE